MDPLLDCDEAAAIEPAAAALHGCRGYRIGTSRVLGSVLVAREIAAYAVPEGVEHGVEPVRRRKHGLEGPRAMDEFAAIVATQPAPERAVSRRHLDAAARGSRKIAQPRHVVAERERGRATDANDRCGRVDRLGQSAQGRPRARLGLQVENEVTR